MTSRYYILLQDKPIESESMSLFQRLSVIYVNTFFGRTDALKGSLLVFAGRTSSSTGAHLNHYHLAEDPNKGVECEAHEVEHLTINDYVWLLPINQPKDRYEFYNQKEKYKTVTTLAVEDRVWVSVPEEGYQGVDQFTCCIATVRYIGPVPEKQGNYFGLELEKRLGTCDGTVREKRYFHCRDLYGIYLPANHIISKSAGTSQVPSVSEAMHPHPQKKVEKKGKLLVPCDKSSSGREFREGDRVAVYDYKDKEHIGTVKWAYPGKEKGIDGYIIGVELNYYVNKKQLFQDLINGWEHYFKKPDYRNHTYLTMHEMFVSTVGKSAKETPVDGDWENIKEDHFKKDTFQPTESVRVAAAEVTKRENESVESVLKESEVVRKKIEEDVQKQLLIDAGVPPEELKEQKKQLQQFQQEKELKDERRREKERKFPERHKLADQRGAQTKSSSAIRPESRPPRYVYGEGSGKSGSRDTPPPPRHKRSQRSQTGAEGIAQHHLEIGSRVEVEVNGHNLYVLKQENITLQESLKQSDKVLANERQEKSKLATLLRESEEKRSRLISENVSLANAKTKIIKEKEDLTATLAEVTKKKKQLKKKTHLLTSNLTEMTEEKLQLEAILREIREEKNRMEHTLRDNTVYISKLEGQLNQLKRSWEILPGSLRITSVCLGKGSWGEVKVGFYQHTKVAVKQIYDIIISDHNKGLFKREMQIASRIRHPHLVLFIGAVTTGTLTIVTELMETSLRKQLELGRISDEHILPISRDVACALNYLHSLPEPIIHRDVSSANVLLNSKPGGGWMAKLGDFGSANFQIIIGTIGPGAPLYSAPESANPQYQGPKMDVYSYGVLLLEVCNGMPHPQDLEGVRLSVSKWKQPKRVFGEIAKDCTIQNMKDRLTMNDILSRLKKL